MHIFMQKSLVLGIVNCFLNLHKMRGNKEKCRSNTITKVSVVYSLCITYDSSMSNFVGKGENVRVVLVASLFWNLFPHKYQPLCIALI